jgi:hypothetical protein
MERFVIRSGTDTFDVIEGVQLNSVPLSRVAAERLVHEPVKAAPSATIENDLGGKNLPKTGKNLPPQGAPQPAPDLRTTRADNAGGSAGFRIRGCG